MILKGTRPNGASPARRASDLDNAGLIEVTNPCQRGDQFTRNRGSAGESTWTGSSICRMLLMPVPVGDPEGV
jgi:hypothetical protein